MAKSILENLKTIKSMARAQRFILIIANMRVNGRKIKRMVMAFKLGLIMPNMMESG